MTRPRPTLALLALLPICGFGSGCRDESLEAKNSSAEPSWEYEKEFGPGPAKLVLRVGSLAVGLADRVRVEEELVVEPGFEAEFPEYLPDDFEGFAVVDLESERSMRGAATESTSKDGAPEGSLEGSPPQKVRRRKRLSLEPLRSGELRIAPLEVYFRRAGEESESSFQTDPVTIAVHPIEGVEKLAVSPPEGIFTRPPDGERTSWTGAWVAAAAGAGVILVALLVFLRRRPKREPAPPPPHEVAWENLRRLVAMDLVSKGELERFFVYLSGILRQYIEDRFHVRAPELTTEEFFAAATRAPELAPERDRLRRFLDLSDQVKFARYAPPPETVQESFDVVKGFIEETTPHEP